MKRAQEVVGLFIAGADHISYDVGYVVYADALRFSRNNLSISNRPGEFTDAQKYFGLTNDTASNLNVSLWLVPVTNTTDFGAPISMTSNVNSAALLILSIAHAQAQLDNLTVSTDGTDVASSSLWVTQAAYIQLDDAITRANSALTNTSSSSFLLDYQTYVLYLTLDGGDSDIGVEFAGFNYTGFANEQSQGRLAAAKLLYAL